MAAADSGEDGRFAKVSSLYGSGTIAAWYFTMLSVLVSWTLHPRKRKSGSIDVDLIATLTLPAVAAGHVISQGRLLLDYKVVNDTVHDRGLIQLIAATEAPFIVTETFMTLSVILFLVAAWMFCIRRATFVALIGLECFVVECYVHFSVYPGLSFQNKPGTPVEDYSTFNRLFVADFRELVITIIVLLGLLATIAMLILVLMLFHSKQKSSSSGQNTERLAYSQTHLGIRENLRSGTAVAQNRSYIGATPTAGRAWPTAQDGQLDSNISFRLSVVTTLFLPLSFVASLWPIFWHSTWDHHKASISMTFWRKVKESAIRFMRDFFPRTACSITDLDQAVAAVAGATILAFSLYSVARAYFKIWNGPQNQADVELALRTPASS